MHPVFSFESKWLILQCTTSQVPYFAVHSQLSGHFRSLGVDKRAKTSLSLEPTSFKIPFSNFKASINKYILEEWQTSWNNSIGNKLFDIKPTIGEYQSVVRNIRKEEVLLARPRLGHTRVTQSYLLQGEEQPQCVGCDAPFTVRHFLLECGDFAQVRNNCFHVDKMK